MKTLIRIIWIAVLVIAVVGIANRCYRQKVAEERVDQAYKEFKQVSIDADKEHEEAMKELEADLEQSQKELDELNNQ